MLLAKVLIALCGLVSIVAGAKAALNLRSLSRRRASRKAAEAQEREWQRAGDVPEVFADKRSGIAESRRRDLEEWCRELGMTYNPDGEYNYFAMKHLIGQRRADAQVYRLERVRQMLLSCLDGHERRVQHWIDLAEALRFKLDAHRDALHRLREDERSRRLALADALASTPGTEETVSLLRRDLPSVDDVKALHDALVALLEQGIDPSADYQRVRALAINTHGPHWILCPSGCGHYIFEHDEKGGCLYPGVTSQETVARLADESTQCPCTTPGTAKPIDPATLPVARVSKQGRKRGGAR